MFNLLQKVWVIDEMKLKEGVITGVNLDDSRFNVSLIDTYRDSSTRLDDFNSYKAFRIDHMNEMGLFASEVKAKAHLIKLLRTTLNSLEKDKGKRIK